MSTVSKFTLSGFIFGLLLFGAVVTMILNFSGSIFTTYNQTVDTSELSDAATKVNTEINQDLNKTRQEASSVGGGIGANLFFLKPIWNVIRVTLGSFTLIGTILNDLTGVLPIPTPLQDLVSGFIIIGLAYAIVRLYRGGTA